MNGGINHQELAETNEFSIAEQCVLTGDLLGQWTEPLVEAYPRVTVVGVAGNHPRVSKQPANKRVFDNFDWLSYKRAEAYLSRYATVEFHLPRSGYHVHEVAGRNMLFFHGDGIRSSMPGVPWGGIMRRVNEMKKQYASQGVLLDYFALGHFHQANIVQSSIFCNGSVKGLDEYTLKQFGGGEPPTQLLLTFCRDKRRLTDVSFINP
jgi:predicted phosphodiesterase